MSVLQPVSSPYADLFVWKSSVTIPFDASGGAISPSPDDTETDQLQFLGDSFFVLMGFMGSTNYDNYFIQVPVGGVQVLPARIPNNFSVLITQNNDQKMMSQAMPQACICGSGYTPGHQFPYPMILPPMTSIDFEYAAINPFFLFSDDNDPGQDPIDLQINFGLYGYNCPTENLGDFLASWAEMQRVAATNQPLWLKNFTSLSIDGLTA